MALQTKNSTRNFSAMLTGKSRQKQKEAILQIDTLCCQQTETENKGGSYNWQKGKFRNKPTPNS